MVRMLSVSSARHNGTPVAFRGTVYRGAYDTRQDTYTTERRSKAAKSARKKRANKANSAAMRKNLGLKGRQT